MTRRLVLVLGVSGLVVSAASRVTAAGPAQVDVEGQAGSTTGQWACGPTARVTYGGAGGHVRYYVEDQPPKRPEDRPMKPEAEPPPPAATAEHADATGEPAEREDDDDAKPDLEPHGLSLGGGGGLEHRDYTRIACHETPCDSGDEVPRPGVLGAGRANLGYDWDYFGVRLGALAFQLYSDNEDRSPRSYVLPDVDLRFGRRAGFHGGLGFGAYNVATIFRPGAFLSLGYASGGWAADLRGGIHAVFDGQLGGRFDLGVRYGISRVVAPGIGVALTTAEQISPEGRVFIVFTP